MECLRIYSGCLTVQILHIKSKHTSHNRVDSDGKCVCVKVERVCVQSIEWTMSGSACAYGGPGLCDVIQNSQVAFE